MSKHYLPGTKFRSWSLLKEGHSYSVRRWITLPDGKQIFERLPKKKYAHFLDNPRELEDFVIRLNHKDPDVERAKVKIQFRHAYINEALLQDYQDNYLSTQIPDKQDAKSMFAYLQKYALGFFIAKADIHDPLEWHRQQHLWGKYLLNGEKLDEKLRIFEKEAVMSAKVLRYIVNELNRFIKYLHLRRPDEVPALKFEPLSRATLKEHEARRQMTEDVHVSKFIKPEHWAIIRSALENQDAPWRWPLYLAYYYGLRRNEAMGLKVGDVRKTYLSCERQFEEIVDGEVKYAPLKSRKPRKVPHWFATPDQAHQYIEKMHKAGFIHPDTLSVRFSELMTTLKLPDYVFHDTRRCFITNAVKKNVQAEELRLAVGHSTIQTTYRYYVMDARELDDEVWIPQAS